MKKLTLIIVAVLIGFTSDAQETGSKLDLRFGIGTSLLGTGDMITIMLENEANFKLNRYFTLSGGVAYAKSIFGVFDQAAFIQLNSNIFISPFRNNRKNDFRVGTGLSWYSVSDVYLSSASYENGQLIDADYELGKRNSRGFNIIIENTYTITEKFLLGVKLFTQPYKNGDINSGFMLKFGFKI